MYIFVNIVYILLKYSKIITNLLSEHNISTLKLPEIIITYIKFIVIEFSLPL